MDALDPRSYRLFVAGMKDADVDAPTLPAPPPETNGVPFWVNTPEKSMLDAARSPYILEAPSTVSAPEMPRLLQLELADEPRLALSKVLDMPTARTSCPTPQKRYEVM
jgi:hypothetical protein